jgi:hypothetical protein
MNDTLFPRVASSSTSSSPAASTQLPHHKLLAYGVAVDLLLAVRRASVRDAKLRDEALRSAKSACLNCAEGAGRGHGGRRGRREPAVARQAFPGRLRNTEFAARAA